MEKIEGLEVVAELISKILKADREALLDHFCTEHRHQVCPNCVSAMRRADAGIPSEKREHSEQEMINLSTKDADHGK